MIDWALETYTMIGEEQPQELIDRQHAGFWCDKRIAIQFSSLRKLSERSLRGRGYPDILRPLEVEGLASLRQGETWCYSS